MTEATEVIGSPTDTRHNIKAAGEEWSARERERERGGEGGGLWSAFISH